MKTVIIDTSSAILLFKSGMISYFLSEYRTFMTTSVHDEIIKDGYPGSDDFREYFINKKIITIPVKINQNTPEELIKMGAGERDSIIALIQGTGDFIVIDDRQGAAFCRKKKFPYINALLVPKILCESKIISHEFFEIKYNMIVNLGRYSSIIKDYAYNCPKKDIEFFLPKNIGEA